MFTSLLLSQLTSGHESPVRAARFNPSPPGVVRCRSATHAIYEALAARPGMWLQCDQIIHATGHSCKAVSWGLLFLQRNNVIETTPDTWRNSRYLLYRLRVDAPALKVSGE